jgi:hypothetical protein
VLAKIVSLDFGALNCAVFLWYVSHSVAIFLMIAPFFVDECELEKHCLFFRLVSATVQGGRLLYALLNSEKYRLLYINIDLFLCTYINVSNYKV